MSLTQSDLNSIQTLMTDSLAPFIESVEVRFDNMNTRFDGIDERLDNLEAGQTRLENRVTSLTSSVDSLGHRMDSLEGRLSSLESDIKELYSLALGKKPKLKDVDLESRLLETYNTVVQIAKEAKIKLPHEA